MARYERFGELTYLDDTGDEHVLYPITKKDYVEGVSEIESAIGNLSGLNTASKDSLVLAINEVFASVISGGSGLSDEELESAIKSALQEAKDSGEFDGKDGRGIVSIVRTSGNGAAGTTDTYTITYSDNTTSTFNVYNGANGSSGESSEGASGENGATFTPSVDSDGNLSWSNDKGLANPATVNIKGKDGNPGSNGVSVVSITLTEADGSIVANMWPPQTESYFDFGM